MRDVEKRTLLMLLFKSKYIILLSMLSATSAAVLASLVLPPVYEATGTILVTLSREHLPNAPLQDQAYLKSPNPTEIIDREVAILQSDDMLANVVDDVGIARLYPDLLTNQVKHSPRQDAIDTLKKRLSFPVLHPAPTLPVVVTDGRLVHPAGVSLTRCRKRGLAGSDWRGGNPAGSRKEMLMPDRLDLALS